VQWQTRTRRLYHSLQHAATRCNTLRHTATHCNTLQHTATHCNTLQHTATQVEERLRNGKLELEAAAEPGLFDYVIVNDQLDKALAQLLSVL